MAVSVNVVVLAGARSLTEVVASGLKRLEPSEATDREEERDNSDLA